MRHATRLRILWKHPYSCQVKTRVSSRHIKSRYQRRILLPVRKVRILAREILAGRCGFCALILVIMFKLVLSAFGTGAATTLERTLTLRVFKVGFRKKPKTVWNLWVLSVLNPRSSRNPHAAYCEASPLVPLSPPPLECRSLCFNFLPLPSFSYLLSLSMPLLSSNIPLNPQFYKFAQSCRWSVEQYPYYTLFKIALTITKSVYKRVNVHE